VIWVRLMGGLGNQMFQYAAGRRLAIRRRTELVLDCSWFVRHAARATAPRSFALDCFRVAASTTSLPSETVAAWEYCYEHPVRSRLSRYTLRTRVAVLREPDAELRFDPVVLHAPGSTLLIGYWQSERYFEDAERQIREDFALAEPFPAEAEALLEEIGRTTSISVHVRRGDYVTHERTARIHGAPGESYFHDALEVLSRRCRPVHLFVFSDDVEWCRTSLRFEDPTTFVALQGAHPGVELTLMSRCRHHVISNSTFGWWGAWLNPSREKIVVRPRRWFADPNVDSTDLLPSSWLAI
jgi:hypothetical protein